ncbi:MAG: polysaccharide deacetylase family protein [Desulfosudaceae bacterium]
MTGKHGWKQPRTALVSIHDVMPHNLSRVEQILFFLRQRSVSRLTLLVVPGRNWCRNDLNRLRSWQSSGIELAGHGWCHLVRRMTTTGHRLHGKFISRNEAEHLSLSAAAVFDLIYNCYHWFETSGLRAPLLYVPPAWAMGKGPRQNGRKLPFGLYETQAGVHDARSGRFHLMPVTGYMADTPARVLSLRMINRVNLVLPGGPVRVAIHPDDLDLPLRPDLERHLAGFERFFDYRQWLNGREKALPTGGKMFLTINKG